VTQVAEFAWPIRVYYEDTDAGGVVFYANYLRFMERARSEWLRSLGFEQDDLMRDPGVLFAVRRVEIDYQHPARFNEQLCVFSSIVAIGGASLDFAQRIERVGDGDSLCRASVRVACLRAKDLRPARIPAAIRDRLQANQADN